ncbi:helix-turn-helix transcriptional regulator [Bradyrhizobium sp. WSM 1704]|uniref:helix-turn-helix transcriptional regulator n=1 Tax=Bradyrhizobium semiaridum TaxID=2821404 RepID=UPI001CE24C70|nr:helix-turn-helix transcriptional regulator [Bradyrhizobium semiaridum]MCA6126248.1 helix-turn-helix transcriptional regulator [Bradyrhizobium semiaridum]
MEDLTQIYFKEGWHLRDIRVPRVKSLLASSRRLPPAFCDSDMFGYDELHNLFRTDAYFNQFLRLGKLKWGGWIRFPVAREPWLIAFQRTGAQGPFERGDMIRLSPLAQALAEVADLSAAVGQSMLAGVLDGLNLVQMPALALDRGGRVLGANAKAEAVFSSDLRVSNSRLLIRDEKARQALDRVTSTVANAWPADRPPEGRAGNIIVARREARKPVLMKLLPVHGAASAPFLGAKFILTLTDLAAVRRPSLDIISEAFSLTRAEARISSMIAAGLAPEEIASELKVSRETVRNQIKATFGKTGVHRQSELAALISRIQDC